MFLKQSKTDPYKQGTKVYIGATDIAICPVKAVLEEETASQALFLSLRKRLDKFHVPCNSPKHRGAHKAEEVPLQYSQLPYRSGNLSIFSKHFRH